jgi:outer membrane protein assembly factor BamB
MGSMSRFSVLTSRGGGRKRLAGANAGVAALAACGVAVALAAVPASASAHRPRAGQGRSLDTAAAQWPQFHGDARLTGVSADHTITSANAGTLGLKWMTQTTAAGFTSPVAAPNAKLGKTLVYVGNTTGDFEAINAANGSIVWSDAFGVPLYSTPVIHGNDVWMGTYVSGRVYKINGATGAVECSVGLGTGTMMSSLTEATPPGGKPTVYFGVLDNGQISGPIKAVDEATCKVDWSAVPYPQMSGTWASTSFGIDANGTPLAIIGTSDSDSTVYAMNAKTGQKVWSNRNLHPDVNDVGAGVTISPPGKNGFADGVAYYPGEDGLLYAIDLTTGKTLWTFNYRAATTPSQYKGGRSTADLDGNMLVFGTGTGVMAVNATTGAQIWDSAKTWQPDTEIVSSPLITGPPGQQVVVYGDMNGAVQVLSLATGAHLYSFQTGSYIMASPADASGSILIQSGDGFLYSFGLGGTNSTGYPTTKITSPAAGATVPNPNSGASKQAGLKLSGTATTQHSSLKVLAAIQRNGPNGPWWNSATGSWQPGPAWDTASVSSTGGKASWHVKAPVSRAGAVWHVFARAEDSDGEADPAGASQTVTIRSVTAGPRLSLSASWASPGSDVKASGKGFKPRETVTVSLPGTVLVKATATAAGRFSAKVRVPPGTPYGTSGIEAHGTSGRQATAALYVTSPWTQLGADHTRSGFLPYDTVLNRVEVPDKIYRMKPSAVHDTGAAIESSAAVASKVAYVGNDAGDLEAIRTVSGALAWHHATGGAIKSSPALDISKGLVIVGSDDGSVYAFNLHNGKTVWRRATGGAVSSSPAIAGGVVYVGSGDGKLYALNETSGAVRWAAAMRGAVSSSPAVDTIAQLVVAGDSAGDVTAFHTSGARAGKKLWQRTTGGAVDGAPLLRGGEVYVGSGDHHEYALSESTGAVKWATALGGNPSATAALSAATLFVGSSDGTFYSLSAATGAVQWNASGCPTPGAAVTGVAATIGQVFLECSDGSLAGYRNGGEPVWAAKAGSAMFGTPTISDNAVLIGSGNHGLYVFTPFGLPMT